MSRSKSVFIAAISGVITFLVYYTGAWLATADPLAVSTILFMSVLIHEAGHMMAFEAFGVKTRMIFLVIMAGVAPNPPEQQAYRKLNSNQRAAIFLAGVAGNACIVLLGFLLYQLDMISAHNWAFLSMLNGNLIFFNLLPFGALDGGRLTKLIFDSSPEHEDGVWALKLSFLVASGLLTTLAYVNSVVLLPIFLINWGLRRQADNDDPEGSSQPGALTRRQRVGWGGAYCTFLVIGYLCWVLG